MGIREFFESPDRPGQKMTVDEYYGWIFENSVPGLPEGRGGRGRLTPLEYMRRYGAFEVARGKIGKVYEQPGARRRARGRPRGRRRPRVYTRAPVPPPSPKAPGRYEDRSRTRRADAWVGVRVDGEIVRGWPTPSGKLEFWSRTLHDWGWPELALPTYIKSHVHRQNLDS